MDRFKFALHLAKEVSSMLLSEVRNAHLITAKAVNDYVTESDRKVEEFIRSRISSSFPEDEMLGEEYGITGSSSSIWIIDPIDGTVDFMNHFPCYTVSIAYMEDGEIIFGVVAVPEHGEIFSAEKGKGAFLNGKRIEASTISQGKALAIMVPPHRFHSELDAYLGRMRKLYEIYSDMRSLGSAAISLCYLASGRVSCYYEKFLHIYDVAAGILIAREAGCIVDAAEDGSFVHILAATEALYGMTKEALLD